MTISRLSMYGALLGALFGSDAAAMLSTYRQLPNPQLFLAASPFVKNFSANLTSRDKPDEKQAIIQNGPNKEKKEFSAAPVKKKGWKSTLSEWKGDVKAIIEAGKGNFNQAKEYAELAGRVRSLEKKSEEELRAEKTGGQDDSAGGRSDKNKGTKKQSKKQNTREEGGKKQKTGWYAWTKRWIWRTLAATGVFTILRYAAPREYLGGVYEDARDNVRYSIPKIQSPIKFRPRAEKYLQSKIRWAIINGDLAELKKIVDAHRVSDFYGLDMESIIKAAIGTRKHPKTQKADLAIFDYLLQSGILSFVKRDENCPIKLYRIPNVAPLKTQVVLPLSKYIYNEQIFDIVKKYVDGVNKRVDEINKAKPDGKSWWIFGFLGNANEKRFEDRFPKLCIFEILNTPIWQGRGEYKTLLDLCKDGKFRNEQFEKKLIQHDALTMSQMKKIAEYAKWDKPPSPFLHPITWWNWEINACYFAAMLYLHGKKNAVPEIEKIPADDALKL